MSIEPGLDPVSGVPEAPSAKLFFPPSFAKRGNSPKTASKATICYVRLTSNREIRPITTKSTQVRSGRDYACRLQR
jgi:hypothetical protein